jgi:hypothetical protein
VPPSSPIPQATPPPAPLPPTGQWEASQTGEADFFADDGYGEPGYGDGGVPGLDGDVLPGTGADDLLEGPPARPSLFTDLRDRLGDFVPRDSPTFIGVVVAGCFLLVVVMLALVRACT